MDEWVHRGGSIEGKVPLETLGDSLLRSMKKHGDSICLTNATRGSQYTYKDTVLICTRLAKSLQTRGYKKGDIVTLYGFTSEEYIFVVLASLHAGLTVNTINPAATKYELRHYLKEVQSRLIFTEESLLDNIEASINSISKRPEIILRDPNPKYPDVHSICEEIHTTENIRREPFDVKNDVAFILFSSGTTGLPKGVLLTHYNIGCSMYIRQHGAVISSKVQLVIFPVYHVAGMSVVLSTLNTGNEFVFLEKYNFELLLKSIEKYKPGQISLPPPVIIQLTKSPLVEKYNLSSVQICHTGAAPLKKETEEVFMKTFKVDTVQQGYGLTESSAGVIWSRSESTGKGQGSSGKVAMGVEIKIIDPQKGITLGPRERGELLIRSPLVMKGYMNNPEATRSTLDQDGWLHTGDVSYFDEDGYFYIVDRLKELIKYKGNQVAPAELEALVLEHPDVADVGVVGVPHPEGGEAPRAFVVKKPGSGVNGEAIKQYVKERASHYKQLRGGVTFVSEIPKLGSGKILRHKLRELAQSDSKL